MSDAVERGSGARDIAIVAFSILLAIGFVALIWFVIDRYEGDPLFEEILALLVVAANIYAVVACVRLLWLVFRRRR